MQNNNLNAMCFSGGAAECVTGRNKLKLSFKADDGSYLRGGGRDNLPNGLFADVA
jgi:hypothetical protein